MYSILQNITTLLYYKLPATYVCNVVFNKFLAVIFTRKSHHFVIKSCNAMEFSAAGSKRDCNNDNHKVLLVRR